MTSADIRKRFLEFFKNRQHAILDSASLVTTDTADATNATLFNSAGMQPLVPFLLGEQHPEGNRLASSQKCVRTGDLDEVGDNTHLTFFEMLGNWSLGDYFKEDAIKWSWEFLTDPKEGLGLDPQRIYVTVFAGNDLVSVDSEAVEIWKQHIPEHRIYYRDSKDNWWTAGPHSPAGPSTEMFYDVTGALGDLSSEEFQQADDEQKIVEIWNDVFMSYRQEGGEIVGELPKKNVDTGAGLERLTAVVQGVDHVFHTDLFTPLIDHIVTHAHDFDESKKRHTRIIADHIKTAVFMLNDGVVISNTGRGYVLRRVLRRAYDSMESIGLSEQNIPQLVHLVVAMYGDLYFKDVNEKIIARKIKIIATEMDKIIAIINRGEKTFKKLAAQGVKHLDGSFLAQLRQTQGLPFSITKKLAKKYHIDISQQAVDEYKAIQREHQRISRKGGEEKFKGGLAEDTPKIRALHTVTHLMLAGLRKYLGDTVQQKGSNITEQRTRFDVTYESKIERDVLEKVEAYVNEAINSGAQVGIQMMNKHEAEKDTNVIGSFWERYPETVSIYQITGKGGVVYSRELCGGPHVNTLSDIAQFGQFRITKEESSSAGVRRIKGVLG